jgi:sensor histidine kinase YesM
MACSGILVLFGVPADALYDMTNERILFIAIAKLTQIFCIIFVVKLSQWRKSGESLLSAIPLLLCQVFSIFIGHSMYLGISEITQEMTLSFLVATIGLLYINIIIFLYVERIKKIDEIKRNNALAEQLYKSKLDYFEQVKQDQEQTRALWHDIQKYMNTMQELLRLGDPADARECIGHVSELFDNTGTIVDVGNTVVSAVLNHGVQKARRQNIDIEMDVRVPEELSVTAADLSVIIGNTFDNAIEAVTKLEEDTRSISLRLIQKNDLLFFEIANPVPPTAVPKKKNAVQGYGLKNVRRCVDKYKGNLTIDSSGGMYKVTALIGVA